MLSPGDHENAKGSVRQKEFSNFHSNSVLECNIFFFFFENLKRLKG